jgi:hypothetical protein
MEKRRIVVGKLPLGRPKIILWDNSKLDLKRQT